MNNANRIRLARENIRNAVRTARYYIREKRYADAVSQLVYAARQDAFADGLALEDPPKFSEMVARKRSR